MCMCGFRSLFIDLNGVSEIRIKIRREIFAPNECMVGGIDFESYQYRTNRYAYKMQYTCAKKAIKAAAVLAAHSQFPLDEQQNLVEVN